VPLRRRASGFALALGVNLALLLVLLGIGKLTPGPHKPASAIVVDLIRGSQSEAPAPSPTKTDAPRTPTASVRSRPLPKPPPIVLPSQPTIVQPNAPAWVEMSKDELAAADITRLPKSSGGGESGDSEEVGRAPNGDVL